MSYLIFNKNTIKKVLIVGFGLTGKSVAKYLLKYSNTKVDIFDNNAAIYTYISFYDIDFSSYDLIVASPGIPLNLAPYNTMLEFKQKLITDIDLFCAQTDTPIIAITGSNGKSTVVSMLKYVLQKIGYRVKIGGNIGKTALDIIDDDVDFYILELSSFQIDLLQNSKFDYGCLLNISADHLDRYKNFDGYAESKLSLRLYSKQFICEADIIKDYKIDKTDKTVGFNCKDGFYVDDCNIIYKDKIIARLADLKYLHGRHNLINISAILTILDQIKIPYNKILSYCCEYSGLQHRCSAVSIVDDVLYINDSKGTNIGATSAAISSFKNLDSQIILMIGGVAKDVDFKALLPALNSSIKCCNIYGKDRHHIYKSLQDHLPCFLYINLKEAFDSACKKAKPKDVVLLSPACSSFDEFKNYAERGDYFISCVNKLKAVISHD